MNINQRMLKDNVSPIRMTKEAFPSGDFESCPGGWREGQALCGDILDDYVDVTSATVIEVIPKRRPGLNHLHIAKSGLLDLIIDGEPETLYSRTTKVANHWIDKGYNYVRIDILKER